MRRRAEPGTPEDWLERAHAKLAVARMPLPEGGYWEDLCFMAQQAAELAIKAVYVRRQWRFEFTHDIEQLFEKLERHGMRVEPSLLEAKRLTVYAGKMRYPGMSTLLTKKDYRKAIALAKAVMAWAERIVTEPDDLRKSDLHRKA